MTLDNPLATYLLQRALREMPNEVYDAEEALSVMGYWLLFTQQPGTYISEDGIATNCRLVGEIPTVLRTFLFGAPGYIGVFAEKWVGQCDLDVRPIGR